MDITTNIKHNKAGITVSLYYPAEHNSDAARSILINDVTKIRNWCAEKEIDGTTIVYSEYFDYRSQHYCSEYIVTFVE